MRIEENIRRQKAKFIFEKDKGGANRMDKAMGVHLDGMHLREIEAGMLSKAVLRKKITFLAEKLLSKGAISINSLSWDGSDGAQEELALLHVGFLFKNYEVINQPKRLTPKPLNL